MSEPSSSPLQQYRGYYPAKVAVWKRKWLQIAGASVLAFMVGLGAGGGDAQAEATTPTDTARDSKAVKRAEAELKQAEDQLGVAEATEDRLRSQLETAQTNQGKAVANVRAQARAAQRAAVTRAVAKAKAEQKRVVAAAVAKAKAEAAASQPSPPETSASSGGGTDPQFSYCYEANDAGYGDYQQGVDPEYDWYDDNDNDGFVCER